MRAVVAAATSAAPARRLRGLLARESGRYYLAVAMWLVVQGGGLLGLLPTLVVDEVVPGSTQALAGFSVFLAAYVALTATAFWRFPDACVAAPPPRGSWLVRWVLVPRAGTLMAVFVCPVVLLATAVYLPSARALGGADDVGVATAVSAVAVVLAWVTLTLTYAADYTTRTHREGGLRFPGEPGEGSAAGGGGPRFADVLYFSAAVSTTFGATDVEVVEPRLRRVVVVHSLVAFSFNTVIVGLLVASLAPA